MDSTAPEPGAAPTPEPGAAESAQSDAPSPDPGLVSNPDPHASGPLDRDLALEFLASGDRLLERGELDAAGAYYQRVIGFDDPAITAAAVLGVGNVLYRLDRDDEALSTWRSVLVVGETPSSYPAWRQIAAALVRSGDLRAAVEAYRQADRRAPPGDRPEIAARLGWLSKELGDDRAARRYFSRSRGETGLPVPLTYLIIGLTVVVSLTASTVDGQPLLQALALDKGAVAAGEWWRLLTVVLVHAPVTDNPLHLLLNMYALYLVGPLVERIYGWKLLGLMYVLCAAAGSVGSLLFGDPGIPSVGASGAIFGLFGIVLAATRIHDPVLDRRSRAIVGQMGGLIVINLLIGFGLVGIGGNIDNAAHVGGLLAGLWLGFALVPRNIRTIRDFWQLPRGSDAAGSAADERLMTLVRLLAVVALVAVIVVGLVIGSGRARSAGSGQVPQASVGSLIVRG